MASGRKNKGSRHRSHRHKQQKAEDSGGDSDAEQNLRHGPMPESYRNPNASPPWAMEPLPPNVEGPPSLKQTDTDNVDRKGSHSASSRHRKETLEDASPEMDRWDGGAADENLTVAALEVSKGNLIMSNDGLDRKESKIEGDWKENRGKGRITHTTVNSKGSSDYVDTSPRDNSLYNTIRDGSTSKARRDFEPDKSYINDSILIDITKTSEASSRARSSRSFTKDHDYELDDMSPPINSVVTEQEKKRKKNDMAQRSRKSDDTSRPSVSASMEEEEYPISAEKVSDWTLREHTRNIETDKECDSRTRRRQESSSKERGGKDRDRDKGYRSNNDQYQFEDTVKDEKMRQDRSKDDNGGKADRERSSSRHREDNWKGGRHLDEESFKPEASRDRAFKDDRDREQRKKSDKNKEDRISEGKQKDDKQKEVLSGKDELADFRYTEEMHKESRQKENKFKENRYKEDKEPRNKSTVDNDDEDNFKYEISTKRDDYSSRYKEDKLPESSYEEDKPKRGRDHSKEDRLKLKERAGKVEEEDEKDKLDKYRDDAMQYGKTKHDKKKGDTEQSSAGKSREDSRVADIKGKYEKRNSEHDCNSKPAKGQNDKQQDMDERQRGNREGNAKHVESTSKDDKYAIDKDGKYKDDRTISDRDYRDKSKDDNDRHTKRREGSRERRWSSGPYEEKLKDGKEVYDIQRKEIEDRQKSDTVDARPRTEKTRSDRKHSEKFKEDRLEEMNPTKEFSREFDGEKNREHGYTTKQSRDLEGQSESADFRESKVHGTNKVDRSGSKDHRVASSQDQDRMFAKKETNTSENRSKRSRESEMYDVAVADRDHSRSRVRSTDDFGDMPVEKSSRRNKFEASMSVSSSSGTRRPREQNWHMIDHAEQGKQYLGFDEEVRSWEPRGSNQDSDDERRRPFGHDRGRDSRYSLSPRSRGQDEFGKSSESMISKDSTPMKRKQHTFQQSSGSTKNRRVDEGSGERERSVQGSQSNRVSEGRSISQNRQGPSAFLPPPPPYRPGVDNPAVMGAPNSYGDESNPREGGRYDRKSGSGHLRRSEMGGPGDTWGSFGMGNWNPHNQGPVPGPGNMFSFPQGAFLGMGQQFHMPQMFGPGVGRPSADIGFGGGRFHMGDGGSAFPGHGPNHGPMMGWHRFPDGSETHRPLSGFMDTWDGPGRYPDERQRYSHTDWDQYPSRGGWEEPWQGQAGDNNFDGSAPHLHRETSYQGRSKDDGSLSDTCVDKAQELDNPVEDLPEETHTTDTAEKNHVKTNRRLKERIQMMLLHANISSKLVDEDLYKEYRKFVSPLEKREINEDDFVDPAVNFIDEDLEFEVDLEAEELLSNRDEFVPVLPSMSDDIFKEILKIYQKPLQQNSIQKSLVGSFLLPESISKLTVTSLGINPAQEPNTDGQECTSESSAGQPVAGCADNETSTKHEDTLNAVNSVDFSQEIPAILDDTLDPQKEEGSVLGDNRDIESRTNILNIDSISENTDNQMAPVCNDNSIQRIEEPLQTELPDNYQQLTNEGTDEIANDLEATQMDGIEYPQDLSHEESGAESKISACNKLGNDAKEAKQIEIINTEGKISEQDILEIADENAH